MVKRSRGKALVQWLLMVLLVAPPALLAAVSVPATVQRPNIVFVLFDDAGFSDFGAYGSEIQTPTIDAIAKAGVRFTNFHTASTCEASRAMLHSGVDSHQAGQGTLSVVMAESQRGKPGYEGYLSEQAHSLGALMKAGGYATFFAGKWNLGKGLERSPGARGWDRYIGLEQTGADNYEAKVYAPFDTEAVWWEDGKRAILPADFYSSKHYVDRLIAYIDEAQANDRAASKPFFAMLSLQAVHSPQQAPREDYEKYLSLYEAGWGTIRQQRYERQVQMGLMPAGLTLPEAKNRRVWEALAPDERKIQIKKMAIFAGMLERADREIGRLQAHLKDIGQLDNTVFMVMSDNGADPYELSHLNLAFRFWHALNRDNSIENLGGRNSYVHYGQDWAEVSNTPFSGFKGMSTEGGMRVPLLMSLPQGRQGMASPGLASKFVYVTDLLPTILELGGVALPVAERAVEGKHAPTGRSVLPYLQGKQTSVHLPTETIGFECTGGEALFKGDYKIVRNNNGFGAAQWQLFNVTHDLTESINLAEKEPERLRGMVNDMDQFNVRNGVVAPEPGYDPMHQLLKNNWRNLLHHFAVPLVLVLLLVAIGITLLVRRLRRLRHQT